jgi:hypothetical protein
MLAEGMLVRGLAEGETTLLVADTPSNACNTKRLAQAMHQQRRFLRGFWRD